MNKKITALAAILLCAVMMLSVLTACVSEKPSDDDSNVNNENIENNENTAEPFDLSDIDINQVTYFKPADEQAGYIDNNGEKLVPEYLMKINGIPITVEEFRYPYLNLKNMADEGDETRWTDEADEENRLTAADAAGVAEDAVKYVKQTTAYQLMAAKYNLPLTEEEQSEIDASVQSTIDSMNAEGSEMTYEEALVDSYYTDALYRYTLTLYTTANKIFNHLYFDEGAPLAYNDEEMLKAVEDAGYIRTQQLLIAFPDEPTEGTDEEKAAAIEANKAAAKAEAEAVLERINNGEDFMALVEECNDDPGMSYYGEDGYYFTAGTMVQEYEDAAFALAEGEVSGLVESDYGYHIIKRMPLELDYIKENAYTYFGEEYSNDFSARLEATFDTMDVEFAPEYEFVSPLTVK